MPPKRITQTKPVAAAAGAPVRRPPPTNLAPALAAQLNTADPDLDDDDDEMLATLHALNAKRARARAAKAQATLDKIRASVDATRAGCDAKVGQAVDEAKKTAEKVARGAGERAREARARVRRDVGETEKTLAMVRESMTKIAESRRGAQVNYNKMWETVIQTLVGPNPMQHLHDETLGTLNVRSIAAAQGLRVAAVNAAETTVGKMHQAFETVDPMDVVDPLAAAAFKTVSGACNSTAGNSRSSVDGQSKSNSR